VVALDVTFLSIHYITALGVRVGVDRFLETASGGHYALRSNRVDSLKRCWGARHFKHAGGVRMPRMTQAWIMADMPTAENQRAHVIALSDLKQEQTKTALAFWRAAQHGDALPSVDAIDPVALKDLLPHIVLIDVIWPGAGQAPQTPVDFRYRLIGAHSVDAHGVNLTGTQVSDLSKFGPAYRDNMMRFYKNICATGAPVAAGGSLRMIGKGYRAFEAIYVPFSKAGMVVDRILASVVYL